MSHKLTPAAVFADVARTRQQMPGADWNADAVTARIDALGADLLAQGCASSVTVARSMATGLVALGWTKA